MKQYKSQWRRPARPDRDRPGLMHPDVVNPETY